MPAPQIVVFRSDNQLDDELENALASIGEIKPVTHYFDDVRETVEAVRNFQPQIVAIEMSDELRLVGELADEINACSPASTVVAVFRPDQLPAEVSESNILIQALRLGVEDFIRRPISSRDLEQLLARRLQDRRGQESGPLGEIAAFISNKGGVGKSTMAVNVAVELAKRHPNRVLLVDASLQMGVCASQLDLQPKATIVDVWHERDRLDGLLLREFATPHGCGLDLLAAPRNAMEAIELDDAIVTRILMLARRTYDYVIVDTFPLFDRVVMAILDLSNLGFIVTDNIVPTMQSVRGFFDLLSDVEFDTNRQHLLLNRFSRHGGSPPVSEVEAFLERDVEHVVPFDRGVIQATNLGRPFMLNPGRFSKTARSVRGIVDTIEAGHEASRSPNRNGQPVTNGEQAPIAEPTDA